MELEHYVYSGTKKLRCGYTTGTCAALAAAGAARLLLTGKAPETVSLVTPKGWRVEVPVDRVEVFCGAARCAVRKDAGDDVDVTDGLLIYATVCRTEAEGISVDGGEGIGRVTKKGLDQPVGAAAINRVPRQMIQDQVRTVCREIGYTGGLSVIISAPGGLDIAEKTFNPQLGIEGGISILGTSGIVEPMSVQALIDTILLSEHQAAVAGSKRLILTPGNYGADFLQDQNLTGRDIPIVKCSNFIGEALDGAVVEGFESVLLVGHIGKLVKLAGGIMNTHSRWADCRTELFCAHAAIQGADTEICRALMEAATTDACIQILEQSGLKESVMKSITRAVEVHLIRRAAGQYRIGAVLFSNVYGILGQTEEALAMMEEWK